MSNTEVEGRCLCGAVRFRYRGAPNWMLHCHCESCRRATSSPMTTWISVPREAFEISGPLKTYASSPGVTRSFCAECGSPLSYENVRMPGEIHLYAASLCDASEVTPSRHVFTQEQLPWFEVDDSLPRFATTSRGAVPVRIGPRPR
ncbi:MAG: GFA family protein [Hyphomicrobiaceae bacterium]|nr:GFA family protein [Hyphomicrobiaceae bacterium]